VRTRGLEGVAEGQPLPEEDDAVAGAEKLEGERSVANVKGAPVAPAAESNTPLRVDPLVRNWHSLGPRYLLTEFAAQELYYLGQR
jgi:hypothetical protein